MIYDIYFEGLTYYSSSSGYNKWYQHDYTTSIANLIKGSPDDTFVMVTTKAQEERVLQWLKNQGLTEYVTEETPYVYNDNYPNEGPKLKVRILNAKKVQQ